MEIFLIIYILLGIHSSYYFIKCFTIKYDFKYSDIPLLLLTLSFPIITHLSTYIFFDTEKKDKILFKKRK